MAGTLEADTPLATPVTRAHKGPACAPHRRLSCSAFSSRWASSPCRWSASRTLRRTRSRRSSGRTPCAGSRCDTVPGKALRSSSRASFQARADAPPAARGAAPGRPEVLVTRTGVPSFDLLGVTWRAGAKPADLTVLVRTHGDSGWTRWTALDATPTPDAREARTARPGTEPLWVGDADGYQVRVDVRRGTLPRGLRVDLVDPGSSDADDEVRGRPADAVGPGRRRPAGDLHPGAVGRRRVDPRHLAVVQHHGPHRLRAPHGRRQRLLRRRRSRRSCGRSTRTTSRATTGRTSATTSWSTGSAGSGRAGTAAWTGPSSARTPAASTSTRSRCPRSATSTRSPRRRSWSTRSRG